MFCPKCRSEYRPGFTSCKTCGGVALVETLPERVELSPAEAQELTPVGIAEQESARLIHVDGRDIDPTRVFSLAQASELKDQLQEVNIASLITPLDLELADGQPRFELRVRPDDVARATAVLLESWRAQVAAEGGSAGSEVEADRCPACGATVPPTVEECPDCGLVVGVSEV